MFQIVRTQSIVWRKNLKKQYDNAEDVFKGFVFRELQGIRFDDYKLMLNLFFKEVECNKIFEKYGSLGNEAYLMSILYMKNLERMAKSLLTLEMEK